MYSLYRSAATAATPRFAAVAQAAVTQPPQRWASNPASKQQQQQQKQQQPPSSSQAQATTEKQLPTPAAASSPASPPGSVPAETAATGTPTPAETPETLKSFPRRMFTAVYNVFSKEKRLEKRPQLQKEFRESYWKDLQELNKTKGKLSIASSDLTRAATSKLFPPLTVTPLAENSTDIPMLSRLQGHVTLVTLACSTYGDNQTKSFEVPFRQAYPQVPVYQISMADTATKAWILKLNTRYTRAKVPREQWDKYFVATKLPVDAALEELQVTNKYVGWVFLVDHRGRVRWRANGVATEQELEALGKCAEALVKEMEGGAGKARRK